MSGGYRRAPLVSVSGDDDDISELVPINDLTGSKVMSAHSFGHNHRVTDEGRFLEPVDHSLNGRGAAGGPSRAASAGVFGFIGAWPTRFHDFVDLSWKKLLFGVIIAYLIINLTLASVYYILCRRCGAELCSFVSAFYFNVVSIFANGGYEGEDPLMLTPGSACFGKRSMLVLINGMVCVIMGAFIGAVTIGKASRHTQLRHRIRFGAKAVVNRSFGHASDGHTPLVLQIRVANLHGNPIVNAHVTLHAVMTTDSRTDTEEIVVRMQPMRFSVLEEYGPLKSGLRLAADAVQSQRQNDIELPVTLWYPITLNHWLEDPDSPLCSFLASTAATSSMPTLPAGLQIAIQVVGQDAVSGASIVARRSYAADELAIGCCFAEPSLLRSVRLPPEQGGTAGRRHVIVDVSRMDALIKESTQFGDRLGVPGMDAAAAGASSSVAGRRTD